MEPLAIAGPGQQPQPTFTARLRPELVPRCQLDWQELLEQRRQLAIRQLVAIELTRRQRLQLARLAIVLAEPEPQQFERRQQPLVLVVERLAFVVVPMLQLEPELRPFALG